MWWWWRKNNRNVVVVVEQENNRKCGDGGGGGGGGKTIEMWWRWEISRNVAVVVYSFTIYEAVLKNKLSVGSMWDRCRVELRSMWSWMENEKEEGK